MKKKLCIVLMGFCLVLMSACGNKEVSVKSDKTLSGEEVQSPTSNDVSQKDTIDSENAENKDSENEDAENENIENDLPDTTEGLVDGMRPEFKEAMDSYEAFYNEYCDFMKKYAENPSDMELLSSYADMLTKAAEASEKFEAWEDNELNDTEMKYYLDVSNRIAKKLLEVSVSE